MFHHNGGRRQSTDAGSDIQGCERIDASSVANRRWRLLNRRLSCCSILKAVLVMLPISIIVTMYLGRDVVTLDGIRLMWQSRNLEKAGEVVLPDDWGHGTIPQPNPNIAQIATLLRAADQAGIKPSVMRLQEAPRATPTPRGNVDRDNTRM